jgi:hypothetical protein
MANGATHSMAYVAESTFGTIPASPVFKPLRIKGTGLTLTKDTLQSEELRSDRQVSDLRHGAYEVKGDMSCELSFDSFDDMLQASMCGTWTPQVTSTATTMSATATTFTRASGSFATDGFANNDVIVTSGFATAGNNGRFRITNVAALALTVTALEGQTMAIEAGNGDETLVTLKATLKTGLTRRSYTFERLFGDLASGKKYSRFTGVELGGFDLSVATKSMAEIKFSLLGAGLTLDTAIASGATYSANTTTSPCDTFSGTVTEGGSGIAIATEISLKLDNKLESRHILGNRASLQHGIGRSNISGEMTVFFENTTLLEKFVNETSSALIFTLIDPAGNMLTFNIPKIKYTGGGPPEVSKEGQIVLKLPFQALLDSTTNTNCIITRTPA